MTSRFFAAALAVFLLTGCASLYFRDAAFLPPESICYSLDQWPYDEYWTGIVFNGNKIGFTHLSIGPSRENSALFEIRSEAVFAFHFLMFDKKVSLKAVDLVHADLSMAGFFYDYTLDGNRMTQRGTVRDGELVVEINAGEAQDVKYFDLSEKLYPAGITGLYPVLHGLALGKEYSYPVYNGETLSIFEVTQRILAFEESELFPGPAFKVMTTMYGQKVISWIDSLGRPQLEIAQGGVILSGLENEATAKQYLAKSVLNKFDVLLDLSLITTDLHPPRPRELEGMNLQLTGIDQNFQVADGPGQSCRRQDEAVHCRIERYKPSRTGKQGTAEPGENRRYLLPSFVVASGNEQIIRTAGQIVGDLEEPLDRIEKILAWLENSIAKKPVDAFTAVDVLRTREAECQGHSFLFAAFARALGIPAKIVNGIVYSEEYTGFLFHTWVEVLLEKSWVPVDPTFGQIGVDATHVKLLEGEELADLLPLMDLIGRLKVKIVSFY